MTPRTWCAVAVVTLVGALVPACGERKVDNTDIQFIDLTQLRVLMSEDLDNPNRLVLIDPRIPADFSAAHIPGAENLRLPDVQKYTGRDPAIDRHDYIVVYGDDPGSAVAQGMTKTLLSRRYSKVRMFAGGMAEWKKAGFAVQSSPR